MEVWKVQMVVNISMTSLLVAFDVNSAVLKICMIIRCLVCNGESIEQIPGETCTLDEHEKSEQHIANLKKVILK